MVQLDILFVVVFACGMVQQGMSKRIRKEIAELKIKLNDVEANAVTENNKLRNALIRLGDTIIDLNSTLFKSLGNVAMVEPVSKKKRIDQEHDIDTIIESQEERINVVLSALKLQKMWIMNQFETFENRVKGVEQFSSNVENDVESAKDDMATIRELLNELNDNITTLQRTFENSQHSGSQAEIQQSEIMQKLDREEIRQAKEYIETVKQAKDHIADIRQAKADIADIKQAKADIADIRHSKVDIAAIRQAKADIANIKQVKTDIAAIRQAKADLADIRQAKADIANIRQAKADIAAIRQAKPDIAAIRQAKDDIADIRRARADIAVIRQAKADIADVRQAKADIEVIRQAKADIADIRQANADIANIRQAKADIAVIRQAKTDIAVIRQAKADIAVIRQAKADIDDIRQAKADIADIRQAKTDIAAIRQAKAGIPNIRQAKDDIVNIRQTSADIVNVSMTSVDEVNIRMTSADKVSISLTSADTFTIRMNSADNLNISLTSADIAAISLVHPDIVTINHANTDIETIRQTKADIEAIRKAKADIADIRQAKADIAYIRQAKADIEIIKKAQTNKKADVETTKQDFREIEKSCPNQWVQFGSFCYRDLGRFYTTGTSTTIHYRCESSGDKSYVVDIQSPAEQNFIENFVDHNPYFLGLLGQPDGTFKWMRTNKSPVYTNWAANEPNTKRARGMALVDKFRGGKWETFYGLKVAKVICKKELKPTVGSNIDDKPGDDVSTIRPVTTKHDVTTVTSETTGVYDYLDSYVDY